MIKQNRCHDNDFSLKHYKDIFKSVLDNGYDIVTCNEFVTRKFNENKKILINRVDIDVACYKAKKILDIFNLLNVKATFFIRLHSNKYNIFDFNNYLFIKEMIDTGHEIGLHSEIIDCENIWDEKASDCLKRDINIISEIFNIEVFGAASHGGLTIYNNLDFWKKNKANDFGLNYEAYDDILFKNSLYVSDSEYIAWKCYNNGNLVLNDKRCICKHIIDKPKVIYLLTHPIHYFKRNIYEY